MNTVKVDQPQAGSGAWLMARGGEKWVVGREKIGFASLLLGSAVL
jgi:hypothetical protein